MINKIIAEYLVDKKVIDEENSERILAICDADNISIFKLLEEEKIFSSDELYGLCLELFFFEGTEANLNSLDYSLIDRLPIIFIKEERIIPMTLVDHVLQCVTDNPFAMGSGNAIRYYINEKINTKLVKREEMDALISAISSQSRRKNAIKELEAENSLVATNAGKYKIDDLIDAPAVALVDSLLQEAVSQGASDIHMEPRDGNIKVRFRVDGVLRHHSHISNDLYTAVLARIKIMSDLDISERRIPQDGKISTIINDTPYDFRVSTLPTIYGEKIVIRVFNAYGDNVSLEKLVNNQHEHKVMKHLIHAPHGIVLVVGPTGSGKTTTLYSFLRDVNDETVNITTIEDPVENRIKGINQTQINPKADLTFASALRSILRQDPNIIMVGEIRDEETAHIAIKAAITGHLVLSTIHTNDAVSTISRLLDMGVEKYLVADSLIGIISQRLVRKLCPRCKQQHELDELQARRLGVEQGFKAYVPKGCPSCNFTGFSGRTGVFEILELNQHIRDVIDAKEMSTEDIRVACEDTGYVTLDKAAAKLVKDGIISYAEYASLLNYDTEE